MSPEPKTCLYCERDNQTVPLLTLTYLEKEMWICPQDLPLLIHQPAKLIGKLPGAERLAGFEGEHH